MWIHVELHGTTWNYSKMSYSASFSMWNYMVPDRITWNYIIPGGIT